MPRIVECVPNFSEGRNKEVLFFHIFKFINNCTLICSLIALAC